MKKIILIGAAILVSSAFLLANTGTNAGEECCDKSRCEQGVCKPGDKCPDPAECCEE